MDYGKWAERMMAMDETVWERHVNPWSGWTRVALIPLFTIAIWSRVWLGWWCLIPLAAVLAWMWWNPRAFPPPRHTDNWMSKGVLGERVWLNRKAVPIPQRHAAMAHWLSVVAGCGMIPYFWGLIVLDIWMTIAGMAVAMGAKLWFIDRMVWLFEDMVDQYEPYRNWLR